MKAYDPDDQTFKPARRDARDQQLRVAVTFNRPGQLGGPTIFGARMSTDSVAAFMPDPVQTDLALAELTRRGFVLTGRGSLSASMRCTRTSFEALFQTKLERMSAPGRSATQFDSVLYPPEGAAWNPAPADYASAFASRIYSGRSVPDVCGLVGLLPHANYLALPVPPGGEVDRNARSSMALKPTTAGACSAEPRLSRRSWQACALCCFRPTPSSLQATSRRSCGVPRAM
jgi:hypothetical protein